MNFFKKNLLVVAPLIIAIFLLSMIPCVGGLQDMTRSHKLRGAAKSGAEFFQPSSSSGTRYLHHQPVQLRHAPPPPQPALSTSNNFHHAPVFYQDQARSGAGAEAGSEESLSWPEVTRVYRLYNLRASRDILIQDNKVSATGTNLDEKGDLGLESVLKGNVVRTRIRGILSDKYICFNKKGRLVLRPKKKARGGKCEFIEESTEVGSRFRSALEPRWHIGFTTKGHALNGAAFDPNQSATFACPSCFLFLKTSSYHQDKYPSNITQQNFDPFGHNKAIGQFHPGLHPDDFLSDFKFPFQPTSSTAAPPSGKSRPVPEPSPSAPHHHHRHLKLPHRRRTRRKKLQSKSSPQNSVSSSSGGPKQSIQDATEPQISISSKYGVAVDSKNNSISRISFSAVSINQLIYNSSLVDSNNSSLLSYRGGIDTQPDSSWGEEQGDGMRDLPEPQTIQFISPHTLPRPPPPVPVISPSTSTLPPATTSSAFPRNIARLRRVKKTHRKPHQTLHSNSRHNSSRNFNFTSTTTTTSTRPTTLSTTTPAPTTSNTTTSKPTTSVSSFSKPTSRHRRRHRHHHYSQRNQTAADATATLNTTRPPQSKNAPTTATTFAPRIAEFISKFPRWR